MIDPQLAKLLNDHCPYEAAAANAYMQLSYCANQLGLPGCEAFFSQASHEEEEHWRKILRLLTDFDQPCTIPARDANEVERYTDAKEVRGLFEQAQRMEREVTTRINALRRAARDAGDEQVFEFLSWYVAEQTFSEIEIRDILAAFDANPLLVFDEFVQDRVKE